MKREGLLVMATFSIIVFLVLAAIILDAYTRVLFRSRLTPYTTTFDQSLPGRTITENGLNADFFCADPEKLHKAVIILGGSEGGKHWSTNTSYIQQLLDQGYCVMVLAYFHAPGIPEYLREIPLETFEKAFQWLAAQEQVIPDEYAVVGHSRGGELALLLASRYPQIKAAVAIAPGSVLFPGSPQGFFDLLAGQHSAWSYQGKPLPFVPWSISLKNAPALVTDYQTQMFEQALRNQEAVESAVIPVEKAGGPILCISAAQDEIWPSTLMCDQIVNRLKRNDFPFHYEHIAHDHTHGWCGPEECWGKVVAFLGEYFK